MIVMEKASFESIGNISTVVGTVVLSDDPTIKVGERACLTAGKAVRMGCEAGIYAIKTPFHAVLARLLPRD